MKIKMITALATNEMNLSFGQVVLVDKIFGEQLVKTNMAVLVEEKEAEAPKKQKPIEETPIKRGRKKKVVE